MKITIAHLYYDLMNLYGESGNIKALKQQLEHQDIEVTIKFLTITDQLDFEKYDLIYIGAGTDNNKKLVLKHLLKYKTDIKKAYEKNKYFIITGNAIDLFGKHIIDINKKKYKALNLFSYYAKEEEFRMVDEALVKWDKLPNYILGFQNQGSVIKENKNNWFQVQRGIGSYPNSKEEGIYQNNFFGTYLIGPILIRNPHLLKYFIKQLILQKDPNFKFKHFNLTLENNAYKTFMENYYKEYQNS